MARSPSLKTICKRLAQALEDEREARAADLFRQFSEAPAEQRARLINAHYLVPAATLLHFAAESGNAAVAQSLLALGADIEAIDHEEVTPLHTAIWNEHEEVALLLISEGADCTGQGVVGQWALERAARFASAKLIKALLKAGAALEGKNIWDEGTALHTAAFGGHLPVLKTLIAAGANIEAHQDDRTTPFYLAAVYDEPKTARALIRAGANPNAADDRRRTPLHFAVRQRNYDMVKLLVESGADISRADDLKQTPLQIALAFADEKMCRCLGVEPAAMAKRKLRRATKDAICFTILLMNYSGSPDYHSTSFVGQLHEREHWSHGACGILKDALRGLNDTFAEHPLPRSIAYPVIEISQFIHFSVACHWQAGDSYSIDGISFEALHEELPDLGNQCMFLLGGARRQGGEPRADDPPKPGST